MQKHPWVAGPKLALESLINETEKPDFFYRNEEKIHMPGKAKWLRAIKHASETGEMYDYAQHETKRETLKLRHAA